MNKNFVLITGAAKRIGKELAIYFAKNGFNVIIHYNSSKLEAEELVNFLKLNYAINSLAIHANFNNEEDIKNIFTNLSNQDIHVNILINSASSFHFDDFFNYNNIKWDENFNTNLKAPYLLSMEYVKHIKRSLEYKKQLNANCKQQTYPPEHFNIINIVDSWSCKVDNRFLSYNLAKLALWRLTEVMALELAPLIRVNGIALGLTMKPDTLDEARFKELYEITPLAKAVNIKDITNTLEFILKNHSICGEIIKIDCGKALLGNKLL